MAIDFTNRTILKEILGELDSEENQIRKRRSYVSYDIYNNNQHQYVLGCLKHDYPKESIDAIRKITSINFARRIVNVEANIYKHPPRRIFQSSSDDAIELLENIYQKANVDMNNKQLNRFYRLDEQCASYIAPNKMTGTIDIRKLQNWQYDVVPDPQWPDQALAYIIPLNVQPNNYVDASYYSQDPQSDSRNQYIADRNDNDKSKQHFLFWSKDYNFKMNGKGEILTEEKDWENPIGRMPIIDISAPKQNSFLLQNDNNLARFTVDFLCMLSDLAEIIRMQGFSQAVLSALEVPKNMMIGPHRVLFLEKKKKGDQSEQPEFQFASPSPDLSGTLDSMLAILRMFLSSRGHKTNVVTGASDVQSFSSGLERLLSMIEEHESSIDDFSLFENVEQQQFDIFKRYSNYLQDSPIEGFELHPDLRGAEIPEDTTMSVRFHEPQMVETEKEKQERLNQRLENQTITRLEYIQQMDGLDEETAREMIEEIDREFGLGGEAIQ